MVSAWREKMQVWSRRLSGGAWLRARFRLERGTKGRAALGGGLQRGYQQKGEAATPNLACFLTISLTLDLCHS